MDENGEVCLGLGLGLGLGLPEFSQKRELVPQKNNKRLLFLDLSIPIDHPNDEAARLNSNMKMMLRQDDHHHHHDEKQGASMMMMSNYSKEDDQDMSFSMNFGRKKLRLTRDQTTLLEDSFRQHTTLNTAQKQTLAEKLKLKPRQVEVWFQNRRARTKLKQTEVECEMLKKNCERLSEENRRLKKEVLELRSSLKIEKPGAAAATSYCPHNHKAAAYVKNGTDRGGGEKKEAAAAAALEVVLVHEP